MNNPPRIKNDVNSHLVISRNKLKGFWGLGVDMDKTKMIKSFFYLTDFVSLFTTFYFLATQKKLWVKPTWKYTKTINGSRFQATLKASEFELKFILTYWGLIGFDFGFINLSNAFIDRLRVPKYHFIAPNK